MFEKDKKFKESIGAFIIAFSELEYGLAYLGVMTEEDLRKRESKLINHIGNPFEKKVRILTEYINSDLIELKETWDNIREQIYVLNKERRFIAHGFSQYYLPRESISTYVKEGKKIIKKDFKLQDIKDLTNKLHELNTGENGVNGVFHQVFTLARINKWNDLVNDKNKIVYKVNNLILTEWKGPK